MKKNLLLLLLAAVFTMISCDNNEKQPLSPEEQFVQDLMKQSKDFDAENLVQSLPGVWDLDAKFRYDAKYKNVTDVIVFEGQAYWDGGASYTYTFNANGKGECSMYTGENDSTYSFDWHYDAESSKLILSGDYNMQRVVSGFNGEYLILDNSTTNSNLREVYKRRVE